MHFFGCLLLVITPLTNPTPTPVGQAASATAKIFLEIQRMDSHSTNNRQQNSGVETGEEITNMMDEPVIHERNRIYSAIQSSQPDMLWTLNKFSVNYRTYDPEVINTLWKKTNKKLINLLGSYMNFEEIGDLFGIDTIQLADGPLELHFIYKNPNLSLIDPGAIARPKVTQALIKQFELAKNRGSDGQIEKYQILKTLQDPQGQFICAETFSTEQATSPSTDPTPDSSQIQRDLMPAFILDSNGISFSLKLVDDESRKLSWEGRTETISETLYDSSLEGVLTGVEALLESPRILGADKEDLAELLAAVGPILDRA